METILPSCAECEVSAKSVTLIAIPEPQGAYWLCIHCMKKIDDRWEELQRVIQEGIPNETH